MAVVRSVEWLSTTITLKEDEARCARALRAASATVRSRLRTGMTTLARTGNPPGLGGSGRNDGGRNAPISLRCAVAIASISSW